MATKTETISQEQLRVFARELTRRTEIDDARFQRFVPPNGWVQIDHGNPILLKIKCSGNDVFAKMYAPFARPYAQVAIDTLRTLSQLPLSVPILPPLGIEDGVIFFPLGEYHSKDILKKILKREEIEQMEAVVKSAGLEALTSYDQITLVKIKGVNYIIDPFDDSSAAIFEYIRRTP